MRSPILILLSLFFNSTDKSMINYFVPNSWDGVLIERNKGDSCRERKSICCLVEDVSSTFVASTMLIFMCGHKKNQRRVSTSTQRLKHIRVAKLF